MHIGCCDSGAACESGVVCEISMKVAAGVVSLGAITMLVLSILSFAGYFHLSSGGAYAMAAVGGVLVIPSTIFAFGDCYDLLDTHVKVSLLAASLLIAITAIILGSLTLHNYLAWGRPAGYLLTGCGSIVLLATSIPMGTVLCPED
jgi:hypothetical protein